MKIIKKINFEKIKNIIDSNNKAKALELSILNHFCQMPIVKLVEMYIEDNKKIEIQFKGEKKVIELEGFETLKDLKRKVVKDFKDNRNENIFEEYPKDIKEKFKNKIEELLKGYKNESDIFFLNYHLILIRGSGSIYLLIVFVLIFKLLKTLF